MLDEQCLNFCFAVVQDASIDIVFVDECKYSCISISLCFAVMQAASTDIVLLMNAHILTRVVSHMILLVHNRADHHCTNVRHLCFSGAANYEALYSTAF